MCLSDASGGWGRGETLLLTPKRVSPLPQTLSPLPKRRFSYASQIIFQVNQ